MFPCAGSPNSCPTSDGILRTSLAEADSSVHHYGSSVLQPSVEATKSMLQAPTTQSLFLQLNFDNQLLSTATGFVCESERGPVLITNLHNATGRDPYTQQPLSKTGGIPNNVTIFHNKKDSPGEWVSKVEPLYANCKPRWVEHPQLGGKVDCVALLLTRLEDVGLQPYSLKDELKIAFGPAEPISVVGFPFGKRVGGYNAIWATGFVASEPSIDFDDLPSFLIDCRTRKGQSGSAVVAHRTGGHVLMEDGSTSMTANPRTRLLGIYSGRINDKADLGIVWKVSAIEQIVSAV